LQVDTWPLDKEEVVAVRMRHLGMVVGVLVGNKHRLHRVEVAVVSIDLL